MIVVYRISNTSRRVPVDVMFRLYVDFSNATFDTTMFLSFVYVQLRAKVFAVFTYVSGLEVAGFSHEN